MKKMLNVTVCLLIVVSAIVYAKIDNKPFNAGNLSGILKTKNDAKVSETNGWIVFTSMGPKDQVQITSAANVKGIIMDGGKMLKQKGTVNGNIDNIIIAEQVPDITNPNNIVTTLTGNDKLTIKLKGINVGTVLAENMKMVLVNDISGAIAGCTSLKGVKIMTQDGGIVGTETERVLVGSYDYAIAGGAETNIAVTTIIKMVKAKKGKIEYVDASNAQAAKPGKTKWKAKLLPTGNVLVESPGNWGSKNVNFAPAP